MQGRILLIGAGLELSQDILRNLSEAHFEVTRVANCLEALLQLDIVVPDLVIVNERLPLIDGWETSYLLHRAYGLPVMVIGERQDSEAWIKMLEVGADFYLRLPLRPLELVGRAKAIMRRYPENRIMQAR
ncbi:response regulator [Chloroflexota bacterium]